MADNKPSVYSVRLQEAKNGKSFWEKNEVVNFFLLVQYSGHLYIFYFFCRKNKHRLGDASINKMLAV